MGYRRDNTSGVATGDEPESLYMVTSGTRFNDACCFDYGNAETHIGDDGAGTMEAISWTNGTWGMSHHGTGRGRGRRTSRTPVRLGHARRVTGAADRRRGIRDRDGQGRPREPLGGQGGDASDAAGRTRTRARDHARSRTSPLRTPQHNRCAQGDHPASTTTTATARSGSFYEGAMTSGFSSNETDAAVHADISPRAGLGGGGARRDVRRGVSSIAGLCHRWRVRPVTGAGVPRCTTLKARSLPRTKNAPARRRCVPAEALGGGWGGGGRQTLS